MQTERIALSIIEAISGGGIRCMNISSTVSQIKSNGLNTFQKSNFLDYVWQPAKQFHANTPTLVYFVGYEGNIPNIANQQLSWNVLQICGF